MDWLRILLSRIRSALRGRRLDADLDDELRAHLELATAENRRRGMSPDEARTAALRAFGGVTQIREAYRVQRGLPWIEQMARNIRVAVRRLRRSPGFAITAILTLALGIGAVTSVFTVVDGVMLKPYAFRDPDRLVVLRESALEDGKAAIPVPDNYRHVLRLKNTASTLEDTAIFGQRGLSVSAGGDHPQIVGTVMASPNLFQVLGIQPMLGRGFVPGDAEKGAGNVVVLSYAGWQAYFAGGSRALGQTLRVDDQPMTVIGVLPPEIRFPEIALSPRISFQETGRNVLLYVPLVPSDRDLQADMGNFNYKAIARLKPGVTLAQARAQVDTLQQAYSAQAHLPIRLGAVLTPLKEDAASGISGALWLLFAAVGAVLLIACVNLANLQLARAVGAERETAVRAALGAGKAQLVTARFTESLVLAAAGGALGAALAFAGVRLLLTLAPSNVPRLNQVHVNAPMLLFAMGLSMVAAVVFGTVPALRSLRVTPLAALQANSLRASNPREGRRTRNGMVAVQVACALVLLLTTALVLRSFAHLLRQNRGFDSSHVTLAQVDLFSPSFDASGVKGDALRTEFADRALTALRRLPGVQSAAITSVAPLTGENWVDNLYRPDHPVRHGTEPAINVRWIDPDYLPTMKVPLLSGRNFTADDRAHPYVVLISEETAREGFSGENPVGHVITNLLPDGSHNLQIVGVVADARINGLKDNAAMVYLPYWAYTPLTLSFLVRSPLPSDALNPEMRRVLWQVDPQVAIPTLKSMDDQVSDSVATDRFQTIVLTAFGAAALLLALLGIYGVLAYAVSLRRQEFGIRMALGSDRAALVHLVLGQAALPVIFGLGAGLAAAFLMLRWVRSLLYQTPLLDPLAIGASVVLLAAAAAVAAIVPARRAASVDPMHELRME
jgi:predicted permease